MECHGLGRIRKPMEAYKRWFLRNSVRLVWCLSGGPHPKVHHGFWRLSTWPRNCLTLLLNFLTRPLTLVCFAFLRTYRSAAQFWHFDKTYGHTSLGWLRISGEGCWELRSKFCWRQGFRDIWSPMLSMLSTSRLFACVSLFWALLHGGSISTGQILHFHTEIHR